MLCAMGLLIILFAASIRAQMFEAEVSMQNIQGKFSFKGGPQSEITVHWARPPADGVSLDWMIRPFSTDLSLKRPCDDTVIGRESTVNLTKATGSHLSSRTEQVVSSESLNATSLLGRTLLLLNGEERCCAVILPVGPFKLAEARFNGEIAGRVSLLQEDNGSVAITSNLYSAIGESAQQVMWKVREGPLAGSENNECTGLGNLITDLNTLFGESAQIATIPGAGKTCYSSTQAPALYVGKVLTLVKDDKILACAVLREFKEKVVNTEFGMDGVMGSIKFTQENPLTSTKIEVNLYKLNNLAGSYHIHELPVPVKTDKDTFVCTGAEVAGHFNPHNVDKSAGPADGEGTPDMYEIGDLSGKFGGLTGKSELLANYTDWNLPLFGVNSVVGRSIVIHSVDGSRWVCATIGYPAPVITAEATFFNPVVGKIIMKQTMDSWSDTTIFVELAHMDGSSKTIGHSIHTHVTPNGDDYNGVCKTNGGHYNPYSVSVVHPYKSLCSSSNPERCEVGDISGRIGGLTIGDMFSAKSFYTDQALPLSGTHSTIGRSFVIHAADAGPGRLACADVQKVHAVTAIANTWRTGSVSGSLFITQRNPQEPAEVEVSLSYPENKASTYHIHMYPVPDVRESPCAGLFVSGHYNPLKIDISQSPSPGMGTQDKYEVGDLSGKFGKLSGTSISGRYKDYNLQLFGATSSVGRSVVIHEPDSSRYSCSSLVHVRQKQLRAVAEFTGDIRGYISFSQFKYADGTRSHTTVIINLENSDGSITRDHNWHVHEQSLDDTGCGSGKGHYNPHTVTVNADYATRCNPRNRLRCEIGDMSGKYGKYHIGSGRELQTDEHLQLEGRFSIVGRSIVIHAANSGPSRVACANIRPPGNVGGTGQTTTSRATSTGSQTAVMIVLSGLLHLIFFKC